MSGNFIDKYPYTDFHELNLDWILKKVKDCEQKVDDFTVFNTLTWAGEWSAAKSYVKWSIVQDSDGNGYISVQAVPVNVPLSNETYWKQIAKYTDLYAAFNQRINKNTSDITTNKNAISKNASDITTNKNAISKNASDIATNKSNIAKNASDISKLKIPQRVIPSGILIGHRGCSYAPENTVESYTCGLTAGYDGIEGDLNYTSDGVLIMIHDNTIDRTSNGTGNVRNMTFNQLNNFNYNKTYSSFPTGTLCTFRNFLSLAKSYKKIAEVDIANRTLPDNVIAQAVKIVEEYGMVNKTIFACDQNNYKTILNLNPNCSVSIGVSYFKDSDIQAIYNDAKSRTDRFVMSFDINSFDSKYLNSGMPLKLWTINAETTILNYINSNVLEILTDNARLVQPTGPYHISSYSNRIDSDSSVIYAIPCGSAIILIGLLTVSTEIPAATGEGRTIGQCDFPIGAYRIGIGVGFSVFNSMFGVAIQPNGHINIYNKDTLPINSSLYFCTVLSNTYMSDIW